MGNFLQLKSFWNFLKRNKLFTVINIFGFAVSLAFVVLIGLYVQDEVAVNRSQVNRDRIYRIVGSSQTNFAPPTAPDLANRYPEIERYTLTYNKYGWEVSVESENGVEPVRYIGNALMTDSSFFRIFSFPFVEGTPEQALLTKGETVLTESYARKLFGNQPALGKTIRVDGFGELVVSGVVADFGKETHFANPDFLLWLDNLSSAWGMNVMGHSGWCSVEIYFMAHRQADLPAKAADLDEYVHSNDMYWLFRHDSTNHASFEPLEEVYFSSRQSFSANRSNDARFLTVLGATALLILAFAIINYINLSVAQSGFRAQEAATRRLLGGSRGSLFAGFILESLIICFVSFCLGLLLVQAIVPWFREVMECDTSLADSFTAGNVALALGGVVVNGLCADALQTDRRREGNFPTADQNGLQQDTDRFPVLHYDCFDRLYDYGDPADELHDEDRPGISARLSADVRQYDGECGGTGGGAEPADGDSGGRTGGFRGRYAG